MHVPTRVIPSRGAAALVAIAALACAADDGPMQLAYQFDVSQGSSFLTTINQDIAVAMGGHAMEGAREMRARYTILADAATGDNLHGTVRLDSLRASLIWGQSQERFDTRHLIGREFPMTVAPGGGPPTYDAEDLPAIDMGGRGGGAVPASMLIDYAFPTLPAEPVTVGSAWRETRTNRRLEATMWVTAEVQTTYRVSGMANIEGTRCLMIKSESTGTLSDGLAHGTVVPFSGQLQGSATWCFDPYSGVLVEMIGEEVTNGGTRSPDGGSATIQQTTRVEIRNVTAS